MTSKQHARRGPLSPLIRGLRVNPTARILGTVVFNLIGYIVIGMPLATIPTFVHGTLGFDAVVAGFAVSVQYLATFVSRPSAGRRLDTLGAKQSVLNGLLGSAAVGLLTLLAGLAHTIPLLSLLLLLASRLLLGFAESWVGMGCISWGIGRVGASRTAQVISLNGVTTYGGIALGAPLGLAMARAGGLTAIGALSIVLALGAWAAAARQRAVTVTAVGERVPFTRILRSVAPFGIVLALGSVGFGVIAAFVSLFYMSRGWTGTGLNGAGTALSVFGLFFVAARLVFTRQIGKRGGIVVASASFVVETIGLLFLWQARTPLGAVIGCGLTGAGFALVFPALGVLAVARVAAHNRGSALGAFSVFLDISIGLSGPLLGLVAKTQGYAAIYLCGGLAAALGFLLCLWLRRTVGNPGLPPAPRTA